MFGSARANWAAGARRAEGRRRTEGGGRAARGPLERAALAAVDGDAGAGDPAGARGAQERDDVGDLLGAAEAAGRDLARDEGGDAVGVGLLPAVPAAAREQDRSGRDAEDADAMLREIARHRLGQADLGGLG